MSPIPTPPTPAPKPTPVVTDYSAIVKIATSYLGEREIPNNMGFTDKQFEKKMIDVGFEKGYAWCALFLELVIAEGAPAFYAKYKNKFSTSSLVTFNNFKALGMTTDKPSPGYGVIWKHGNGPNGHTGVVTTALAAALGSFHTVEGNTNDDGSREGYEVAAKVRAFKKPFSAKGLNLVGFIKFDLP